MEFNFAEKSVEDLEARKAELLTALDAEGADIDAIEAEARAIKAELEARKAEAQKKAETRKLVAEGAGEVKKEITEERKATMTLEEIRASKEYIDAYANYIKTGRDEECRTILSANAVGVTGSGPVPVPEIVDQTVRTAWEKDAIMSRVHRTFIRGNLKVTFECSATPAEIHNEGANPPQQETLLLGTVELIPANIKKWITITDEAMTMGGEEFLRYIYDEITYQIVRKAAAEGINDVINAPEQDDPDDGVGVPVVAANPSLVAIPTAAAHLSEAATNLVVVMNRLTEADFVAAQAAGSFAFDPFAGIPRVYTSALNAFSACENSEIYAIVGDLSAIQFNFPEGDGVVMKYDDLSLAEKDLVKIVGRLYAGHGVTAPGKLVKLVKTA